MLVMPPKERTRRECEEYEKRQNRIIRGLLNENDTETVINDNITINDCLEAPIIDFKIYGKEIKQETREGYNKLKNYSYNNESITDSGITVTLQKNGKILINGTSVKENWFEIMYDFKIGTSMQNIPIIPLDNSKTYTIIVKKISGTNSKNISVSLQKNVNTVAEAVTISPSATGNFKNFTESDGLYRGWIYIQAETICSELELEIMVLEGDYNLGNAPAFEKNGQSPSIEYLSNLEYVEGNQKIEHINKNFLDEKDFWEQLSKSFKLSEEIYQGVACYKIERESASKWNFYYPLHINGNVTIQITSALFGNCEIAILFTDGTKANIRNSSLINSKITATKEIKQIYIAIYEINGSYIYIAKNSFQIEKGIETTEYVEHKSEKYPLTNLPELYSKDDYIYYNEISKKYFVCNEWDKYIFTGNEIYSFIDQNDELYKCEIRNAINDHELKNTQSLKCNFAITSNVIGNGNIRFGTNENANTIVLYLKKDMFSTANELKDFVKQKYESEEFLYAIYKMETPTDTEITDTVLIEQLDKLRTMFLYKGTNNFIVTAENGQSANLKLEVYKDSIKIMKEQINDLKQAILNN